MKFDNIAAISTGLSASGVAIIRISGSDPLSVAEKMFAPSGKVTVRDFQPNRMYPGEIICEGFTDYGMAVYFKSPKSFTGEDIVEFHSHGGVAIAKGVLQMALKCGARLAKNGEFTKRAFMNGKLSLASCEGLIDMINSSTESGVKAGYYLYREKLTEKIISIQDKLTELLAEIDADMDYPEEDLEVDSVNTAVKVLAEAIKEIDALLSAYKNGRVLKEGVKVAICGKPNTGKSSLLNAFMGYNKAIVSDEAGTTRDVVEGSVDINGVRFNFYDTAGIRESDNAVERIGVGISKKTLNDSDIVLFVTDDSFNEEDREIERLIIHKEHISVCNKCDKDMAKSRGDISVSAKKLINIENLLNMLYDKTVGKVDLNGDFITEERHYECLLRAKEKLLSANENIGKVSLDLSAIDIKDAWDILGEISGKTATEEIIDGIFKKFCVGK